MKTTLNAIREHQPCKPGWSKLLATLGKVGPDDEPLSLLTILNSNGLDDAVWCLRAVDGSHQVLELFRCWVILKVNSYYPKPNVLNLEPIFDSFTIGKISLQEFDKSVLDLANAVHKSSFSLVRGVLRDFTRFGLNQGFWYALDSFRNSSERLDFETEFRRVLVACNEGIDPYPGADHG